MREVDPGQTCLRKVHLAAPAGDPLLLKLRLGSALQANAFHPPGLPPDSILLVRRLASPPTDVLRLGEGHVFHVWQRALSADLETISRQAFHPARGAAPANAPAVLFAGRTELLACLGRDWIEGRLDEHWWWRSFLGEAPSDRGVVSAWARMPEYLPGALDLLAGAALRWHQPGAVGETLGPSRWMSQDARNRRRRNWGAGRLIGQPGDDLRTVRVCFVQRISECIKPCDRNQDGRCFRNDGLVGARRFERK